MKINKKKILNWIFAGLMSYVLLICVLATPYAVRNNDAIKTLGESEIIQYKLIDRLQDKQFTLSDSIFQQRLEITRLNHKIDSLSHRLIDFDNELTEIFD